MSIVVAVFAAMAASAEAADFHAEVTEAYMTGRFDELTKLLDGATAKLADLSTEQRADVVYVRKALAECRPAWWALCKGGAKGPFRPALWGKTFGAMYDPDGKGGVQMKAGQRGVTLTVSWKPDTMDSTGKGEYGFLAGDQACVSVWANLATAQMYTALDLQTLAQMNDRDKLRLNRYMSYRSNLAALYYCTPPGRRYAMHIYFAAFYYDNWGKSPTAGSRRAPCTMMMMEILKNPSRYPSLKLPDSLPDANAEETLGKHFKHSIKRGALWTIAEDRHMREAIKTFAAGSDQKVFQTEMVDLPNKLVFALDAEADKAYRPKRDAWFKQQFDRAAEGLASTEEDPPEQATENPAADRPAPQLEYRVWTSANGRFRVEAAFVKQVGGVVRLRRKDTGEEIPVPVEKLSDEDKAFLKKRSS